MSIDERATLKGASDSDAPGVLGKNSGTGPGVLGLSSGSGPGGAFVNGIDLISADGQRIVALRAEMFDTSDTPSGALQVNELQGGSIDEQTPGVYAESRRWEKAQVRASTVATEGDGLGTVTLDLLTLAAGEYIAACLVNVVTEEASFTNLTLEIGSTLLSDTDAVRTAVDLTTPGVNAGETTGGMDPALILFASEEETVTATVATTDEGGDLADTVTLLVEVHFLIGKVPNISAAIAIPEE